ncbi:MAG: hypothetical protein CFE43_17535 [Burkholderiales bacterium PBB3]|nr:MAG: hypothetical protein CFE43_17535 [Burkholderiales bacterium PBB3]
MGWWSAKSAVQAVDSAGAATKVVAFSLQTTLDHGNEHGCSYYRASSTQQYTAVHSIALSIAALRGQHRKYLPYVFTEHGAIMAAMVLNSPHAVEVSVYVVRAFVRLRESAVLHKDLADRLTSLEEKTEALAMSHDTFLQPGACCKTLLYHLKHEHGGFEYQVMDFRS